MLFDSHEESSFLVKGVLLEFRCARCSYVCVQKFKRDFRQRQGSVVVMC